MSPTIVITTICASVVFFCTVTNSEANAKETLHLGALISQDSEVDFTGFIPAMNLALETIENDTTLPFRFSITLNDSMVRANWVCNHTMNRGALSSPSLSYFRTLSY